ncbi:hypothetical protein [Streptomyces sp. KLOTTS4A1]|uniref:hypothetical protein n=1 Tax=Streptomyces sp. KLOTTS4A1 TaxID=3390996 RepID=UPI0039F646C5
MSGNAKSNARSRSEGSAREQARRLRRRGLVVLPIGLAVLVIGALTLFGLLPRMVAEERAFTSAVPCAAPDQAVWQDCLQPARFKVVDKEIRGGKQSVYRLGISGPGPASGRVELDSDAERWLRGLDEGDEVEATVWRGEVVAVHDGERNWATEADPTGALPRYAAGGSAELLVGAPLTLAGLWWLLRPHSCVPRQPRTLVATAWLAPALLVDLTVAACVQFLNPDASLWLMAKVWLGGAAVILLATAALLRSSRSLPRN